jgi:hypothetical protein
MLLNETSLSAQNVYSYGSLEFRRANFNLETDSIAKVRFRSKFSFLADYKRMKPKKKFKKMRKEYDHFHININTLDSTFTYYRMNENLFLEFKITSFTELEQGKFEIIYFYGEDKCGNGVNVKILFDEEKYYLSIYHVDLKSGRMNCTYLEVPFLI